VLTASPSAITFRAVQGSSNPPGQTASLAASTSIQVNWIAFDNATWLMESPASGAFTNGTQLTMMVNAAGLAVGTYSAMVTIQSDKAGNTSIPVTLTVATAQTSGSTSPPPPASPPPLTNSNTTATLSWSPVSSSNLAGYKVYVGTASGRYGSPLDVGKVTSYAITNLVLGNTYFFVVTSYSTSGAESAHSNEVSKSIY
jgi:hypothetical protein